MSTWESYIDEAPEALRHEAPAFKRSTWWNGGNGDDAQWVFGLVLGNREIVSDKYTDKNGDPVVSTLWYLYGKHGDAQTPKPRTPEDLFDGADIVPVMAGRAGLRACFDNHLMKGRSPGIIEGDLVLIKHIGMDGARHRYSPHVAVVEGLPEVPDSIRQRVERMMDSGTTTSKHDIGEPVEPDGFSGSDDDAIPF